MSPQSLEKAEILVVDDSRDWLDYLQRTLQRQDFTVHTLSSPEAVLDALDRAPIDLLILDTETEDLCADTLLQEIRGIADFSDLPFLLLMPHGETPDLTRDHFLPPCDFVQKPFGKEEFVTRVRALMRIKRLQDRLEHSTRKIQGELELAKTVQQNLLPLPPPSRMGLDIAARYLPSLELGGDFFDVVDLGRTATGLFLADVVGHGVSSALFTSFLKAQLLHWSIQMQKDKPGDTLTDMNQALSKTFRGSGRFVTALYATYQPGLETLFYANAGHPAPLRIPAEGDPEFLEGAEVPLGILATNRYATREAPFRTGDRIFLFTDGILEQRVARGTELFGKDRIVRSLVATRDRPLEESLAALLADLEQWAGRPPPYTDDVNILAFERRPLEGLDRGGP